MAFLSTLCTFAHNTMIFNMLYGVYTKSFHIHSCLHPSADKAYSLVPGRRNSIGGEKILLVRHFFLSPYTEMTRSQCKQLHIVVQTVLTPTFRVQTSADNIAEVHTKSTLPTRHNTLIFKHFNSISAECRQFTQKVHVI